MAKTGLPGKILFAVETIDAGRKGFAIDGKEHEGRIFYERGISLALSTFQEAQSSQDTETMLLVESSFLQQEYHFCAETDMATRNSLLQAIQSIEDALRCLKIVEDAPSYRSAEVPIQPPLNTVIKVSPVTRFIWPAPRIGHGSKTPSAPPESI
jgi:hypothetical protein